MCTGNQRIGNCCNIEPCVHSLLFTCQIDRSQRVPIDIFLAAMKYFIHNLEGLYVEYFSPLFRMYMYRQGVFCKQLFGIFKTYSNDWKRRNIQAFAFHFDTMCFKHTL